MSTVRRRWRTWKHNLKNNILKKWSTSGPISNNSWKKVKRGTQQRLFICRISFGVLGYPLTTRGINQSFNAYNVVLHSTRSVPNNCSCKAMCFTLKCVKFFINTSLSFCYSFKRCWMLPRNDKHFKQGSAAFRTMKCCQTCSFYR